MFWRKSPLQMALLQGQDPGADLADLLNALDETPVKTRAEAEAVCQLLKALPGKRPPKEEAFTSRLHALTALFQDAETRVAFRVLAAEGIPELCRIFDELADIQDEETTDDLLFLLKVLAMYRTEAGTERVIRAARRPLKPEGFLWSVILGQYKDEHPQAERLLRELADPLPPGFLAVALLDCANALAIGGATMPHPFNTAEGVQRLDAWLRSRAADQYSYAHSATAAVPFIRQPERDALLALALDHPEVDVQLEGAWASAKLGSAAGLKVLARYCLDANYSKRACQYLAELGREDAVPGEALVPEFQARAAFANWLAHPNELGRAPDDVQVVDHRTLAWPPDGESTPLWLVKYRAKDPAGQGEDDVNCGMVGSVTFCLFSYKIVERPPDDGYAIHCYWEMKAQRLIRETENEDGIDHAMLRQWRGEPLENPEVVCIAELSPKLKYPQPVVALATAALKGEEGWAVLDEERSAWYPKRDMPAETPQNTVLMVHVGRRLLGFEGQPDRRKFLMQERSIT